MIELTQGNLLTAPADALVNTVNTEGVMGKGIALQFRNAYPEMFKAYALACKQGKVKLGKVEVFDVGAIGEGPRWIINFPTKGHWRARSRLADIQAGLEDLLLTMKALDLRSIAVPPLGCGNGGLEWADVRPLIEQAFARAPQVKALVFAPSSAPAAADMPIRTKAPRLTMGRATLVMLMHRYLQGLLDPFVTLLEVHKLMYFMQEAGQPLKLKYEKGTYGPYAPNLEQVLKRVEGHFITGFGDGSSNPNKELQLHDGVVDRAWEFLARADDVNKRMDRVTMLIDGYEDSYGMELLATVHWVMTHQEDARKSADAAIARVQRWSARKQFALKPEHLDKAWHRLVEQGWHFDSASLNAPEPTATMATRTVD